MTVSVLLEVIKDLKKRIELLEHQSDFVPDDEFGKGYRKAVEHIKENIQNGVGK